MVTTFGIASGAVRASTISLLNVAPYYGIGNPTPVPVISVYCSGTLTDFYSQVGSFPNGDIRLIACAVPSGSTGPTGVLNMISGFIVARTGAIDNCRKLEDAYTTYPLDSICTIHKASLPGTGVTLAHLSGNAYYNVFATHILTTIENGRLVVAGYGDMVSSVFCLTRAPYPTMDDVDDHLEDHGEIVGDKSLETFTFAFSATPSGFAHSGWFGVGYPGLAASGMIQMTCSGFLSGYFFPDVYNGSNSNTAPIYQYCMAGQTLTWKVPKVYIAPETYEDYTFRINYINTSGLLSGPLLLKFPSAQLHDFDINQLQVADNVDVTPDDIVGPYFVKVDGETGRSRIAVGVSDINLAVVQYNEKGTYVSAPFTNEKPIYAVSIEANESVQAFGGFKIWDLVKYYIQFDMSNNGKWYRISPRPRSNELDGEGKNVPNIYILDTNLFAEDRVVDLYSQVAFINLNQEQYSFRIKIEMDTNITGARGKWTPQVYDYRVSVIDREALVTSNFERYLFN